MRVGLIIYGELDTVSGGYLYDRQLVRHLQGQGDDVVTLARRIRTLQQDRSLLARMSLSAHERYRQHPGWEASIASVRQFLMDISQ
jgi:regulator of sirC expression with transglutaminase-like and TPR domain